MPRDGRPDRACTPGAIFPDVTAEQICRSGYSASVRNVPAELSRQVYASYGVIQRASGEYEVDHLVNLAIGGSNDIANLWPQATAAVPGSKEKDRVENYVHDQVCTGRMQLLDAQRAMATDWVAVYQHLPGSATAVPRPTTNPAPSG